MPRFIASPVVVEAHSWEGNTVLMPDEFRLAVSPLPDGRAMVQTMDGAQVAQRGDYVVRGADGDFVVVKAAKFETLFQAAEPDAPAKRAYNRREPINA